MVAGPEQGVAECPRLIPTTPRRSAVVDRCRRSRRRLVVPRSAAVLRDHRRPDADRLRRRAITPTATSTSGRPVTLSLDRRAPPVPMSATCWRSPRSATNRRRRPVGGRDAAGRAPGAAHDPGVRVPAAADGVVAKTTEPVGERRGERFHVLRRRGSDVVGLRRPAVRRPPQLGREHDLQRHAADRRAVPRQVHAVEQLQGIDVPIFAPPGWGWRGTAGFMSEACSDESGVGGRANGMG